MLTVPETPIEQRKLPSFGDISNGEDHIDKGDETVSDINANKENISNILPQLEGTQRRQGVVENKIMYVQKDTRQPLVSDFNDTQKRYPPPDDDGFVDDPNLLEAALPSSPSATRSDLSKDISSVNSKLCDEEFSYVTDNGRDVLSRNNTQDKDEDEENEVDFAQNGEDEDIYKMEEISFDTHDFSSDPEDKENDNDSILTEDLSMGSKHYIEEKHSKDIEGNDSMSSLGCLSIGTQDHESSFSTLPSMKEEEDKQEEMQNHQQQTKKDHEENIDNHEESVTETDNVDQETGYISSSSKSIIQTNRHSFHRHQNTRSRHTRKRSSRHSRNAKNQQLSPLYSTSQSNHNPQQSIEMKPPEPSIDHFLNKKSQETTYEDSSQKSIRFAQTNTIHRYVVEMDEFDENPNDIGINLEALDEDYNANDEEKQICNVNKSGCCYHFCAGKNGCSRYLLCRGPLPGRKWRRIFSVYILPFTYGATSKATTFFFLVGLYHYYAQNDESVDVDHHDDIYDVNMIAQIPTKLRNARFSDAHLFLVGFYLVAEYSLRVIFSSLARVVPKSASLLGTLLCGAGFFFIMISDSNHFNIFGSLDFGEGTLLNAEQSHFESVYDRFICWVAGSLAIGCNEAIGSALPLFIRNDAKSRVHLRSTACYMKKQFKTVRIGCILSFIGLGISYHFLGSAGIGLVGLSISSLQLIVLFIFLILDNYRSPESGEGKNGKEDFWTRHNPIRYRTIRVHESTSGTSSNQSNKSIQKRIIGYGNKRIDYQNEKKVSNKSSPSTRMNKGDASNSQNKIELIEKDLGKNSNSIQNGPEKSHKTLDLKGEDERYRNDVNRNSPRSQRHNDNSSSHTSHLNEPQIDSKKNDAKRCQINENFKKDHLYKIRHEKSDDSKSNLDPKNGDETRKMDSFRENTKSSDSNTSSDLKDMRNKLVDEKKSDINSYRSISKRQYLSSNRVISQDNVNEFERHTKNLTRSIKSYKTTKIPMKSTIKKPSYEPTTSKNQKAGKIDKYRKETLNQKGMSRKTRERKRLSFLRQCCMIYFNPSPRAILSRRRLLTSELSSMARRLAKYNPTDMPERTLEYALPLATAGRRLTGIYIWGSVSLVAFDDFNIGAIATGGLLAGIVFANLTAPTTFLHSESGSRIFQKLLPAPNDLYLCTIGLTISTCLTIVPLLPSFIIGMILYGAFDGMLNGVLLELRAGSSLKSGRCLSRFLTRLISCLTIYSIPLFYALHPRLPLVFGFLIMFCVTVILIIRLQLYKCKKAKMGEFEAITLRKYRSTVAIAKLKNSGVESDADKRVVGYGDKIMLGRLMKGKDL